MNFHALRDRVDLNPEVKNTGHYYLATSPVVKQPATVPYRVVLVVRPENSANRDQLVVWNQYFNTYSISDSGHLECKHPYFGDGHYFRPEELSEALVEFAKRTAVQAGFIASIFRSAA